MPLKTGIPVLQSGEDVKKSMAQTIAHRFRTQADESLIQALQMRGLQPWKSRLLASRGLRGPEQADTGIGGLLHYRDFKGIDEAASRLLKAIAENQRILIVGDYDADGATATAVMVRGLRMLGAEHVDFLVPDRLKHGYGLSPTLAELAHERRPHVLVTVDNGIAALDGIERARSLGMDVVVTDHHLAGATLPPTPWIVNPNQPGCPFASKAAAGVGVAFYVLLAMRSKLQASAAFEGRERPALEQLLDLVALGTVADVVPLDANNRRLVAAGLARMRKGAALPLIQALFALTKRQAAWATSADLGFAIGPRINAAGRLEHMSLGIEGLLCDAPGRAQEIAAELHRINEERRATQAEMEMQAVELAEQPGWEQKTGLVVHQTQWHEGVIGLVASRLKERYWRPTIALCAAQHDGLLKGSGRSIPGLHLRDAIDELSLPMAKARGSYARLQRLFPVGSGHRRRLEPFAARPAPAGADHHRPQQQQASLPHSQVL
ncbi:MAG: DHH family phosphoesterase, partial [Candidatus Binatia bacterium]|nr:DHH family phosphoesterase [Candidatus Binatia bacterium]